MADAKEPISIELSARLCQQTLQETRATRKEVSDIRALCLQTIDLTRRIERRVAEQRDGLELMINAELSGSLANMQTKSPAVSGGVFRVTPGAQGLPSPAGTLSA
jgi:hypothetical protein